MNHQATLGITSALMGQSAQARLVMVQPISLQLDLQTICANNCAGHHDSTSSSHSKPSLMDKLNPKKDADGDGKAGCK